MEKIYDNDDLLMLSGIQHIAFCERQWALIHIEQQWAENVRTVEGHHLHERVDDPFESDIRGNIITMRAVSLVSYRLGLIGRADVVELHTEGVANTNGVTGSRPVRTDGSRPVSLTENLSVLNNQFVPVEYKRGNPKPDERDEVQLCAQAMCLEEMNNISIKHGYLYYGETRHRHEVEFTEGLRTLVIDYTRRMHELFTTGVTPPPVLKPHCKSCSLIDICMPKALSGISSVNDYLKKNIEYD